MLNFCPLCVAEVYALRRDAMRAGTSHYPLHHPTTTYYLYCKDMQFFLICKIHTKRLIHYGYFIFEFSHFVLCWFIFFYKDPSLTLRMTPEAQDDRKGGLLFQGLVGKDVGCDCRCQKDEEEAEGPVLGYEDGAVQEGKPDHGDRNDLDLQRDGLMDHEVPDIWSKSRMVHQPVI